MQCLFREHFQSTMRNFTLLNRIVLTSITFSKIGNNNLNMTFWSKSTRLKQWHFILYASLVYIPSGSHIIQGIGNQGQTFKELVGENIFCGIWDSFSKRSNMILERWIHELDSLWSCSTLWFRNMLFSKQKLSVEIRVFDMVGICESDFTFLSCSKANHCEVLQQFTSNGTRTYHEQFRILNDLQ